MTARIVVMVSGNGSNLQAILDAQSDGRIEAEITGVVSNNPGAYALERARQANVPTVVLPHEGRRRADYDQELALTVSEIGADLVVLAGWNRLLTSHFVSHHTTINLHPARPGAFPGLGAIEKAFAAYTEGRISEGGVMVHYVPDEGVDDGPVIGWRAVAFKDNDTLESYEQRVHATEHELLVECINTVLESLPV